MTDVGVDGPFIECDTCGTRFEPGVRYPVVVEETDEGVELYSFCDETCMQSWTDD